MKYLIKSLIVIVVIFALAYSLLSFMNEKSLDMIIEVGEIGLDGSNSIRYQDMLVYYDTDFERNAYGYELLVESDSGFVIDKGDTVNFTDGTYILSGHGIASDFLKNISVGDIVKIESDRVKITRNLYKSNLKVVDIEDERLNKIITYKSENLYDIDFESIDSINKEIAEAKTKFFCYFIFSDIDEEEVAQRINEFEALLDQKYYCTVESRSVELRGLWHRPNRSGMSERSLAEVREFVRQIYDLGINTLYVETFWHGMTTYYSDYLGLSHPQMSRFSYDEYGNDYMLALISECHKVGIEVHAWFETLNVSAFNGEAKDYINPEWIVYNLDGDNSEDFMDPSNPEVKEFLLNIISEMLEKYDFDGISYDYIRYSESGYFEGYKDSGFSKKSIESFAEQYGYTGDDLFSDVASDESIREMWHEFKRNSISALVMEMTNHIRSIDPEIVISVSPYGHVEHAKSFYMQDVALWCEMGYVDVVLPMIFTDDIQFYCETVESFNAITDRVIVIPGVYSLYNDCSLRKTEEIFDAISSLTPGNSIFASQNVISRNTDYSSEVLSVLSSSSHEGRAVSPTANVNVVFDAWRDQLLDRTERIYSKKMTEEELSLIIELCSEQIEKMTNQKDIVDLQKELDIFRSKVEVFSNPAVKERITEQIDYIYEILGF